MHSRLYFITFEIHEYTNNIWSKLCMSYTPLVSMATASLSLALCKV